MSFFSKLFHHKDVFDDEEPGSSLAAEEKAEAKAKKAKKSKEKDKEPDRLTVEMPYGTFYFEDDPKETGYDGEFDWYDVPTDPAERLHYYPVGCYVDSDSLDTTEATRGFERLTRMFENRQIEDARMKQKVVEKMADENGVIRNSYGDTFSKEEMIPALKISFISLYRDGRIAVSFDNDEDPDHDVHAVFNEDGEATLMEEREFYGFE